MERRKAAGKPAPMLDDVEPLPQHLEPVWYAFRCLSAARANNGFGPLPIALTEILGTAEFFALDPDEAVDLIQALDGAFLEEHAKKAERDRSRGGSK
jgi:hypothetical protein